MPKDRIEEIPNRQELEALFKKIAETKIARGGLINLMNYLGIGTDFYKAPCSTVYHLNVIGGLVRHSLNVYRLMTKKVEQYQLDLPAESIAIVGLFHDLCKANFYKIGMRWNKEVRREIQVWEVDDQLPLGHGEKSISIIQDHMNLTEDEKIAIRWHMLGYDPGVHFDYPSGYPFRAAQKRSKLLHVLCIADYEATFLVEQ